MKLVPKNSKKIIIEPSNDFCRGLHIWKGEFLFWVSQSFRSNILQSFLMDALSFLRLSPPQRDAAVCELMARRSFRCWRGIYQTPLSSHILYVGTSPA